ncbi:hypothetical protein, partial [Aeromicrobium sp.]|uniref:hypothetical protein n=1 Tax=Aeromicrobium sp. TaxID=1871063 RepID=UPI0019A291BF
MTRPMTRPMTRLRSLFVLLTLLALVTGVAPARAAGGGTPAPYPPLKATSSRTATQQVQHVTVKWQGGDGRPKSKYATIPGIGNLQLICKPDTTMIKLYTPERGYETQMWMQKYETKNGRYVVSSKEARIYRWAHAADNGNGGTGNYANEGLNQGRGKNGVENFSQGYLNGVISQQSSRSADGPQLTSPRPVTTFELTWYWNGFDYAPNARSCTIDAVFTTRLDERMVLTWHGSAAAAGHDTLSSPLRGIGTLDLYCELPAGNTDRAFVVTPSDLGSGPDSTSAPTLYVETVTGEGLVADHVEKHDYDLDGATGAFPAIPLPQNGSVRMKIKNGNGNATWVLLSSYTVLN